MIPIVDTNILYAMVHPNEPDANKLISLLNARVACISDVSIIEWIVRNARPEQDKSKNQENILRLQKGLSLIDGYQLKHLRSEYIELADPEIDVFRSTNCLHETDSLRKILLQRRIDIESQFLYWIFYIALTAYASHIVHSLFPNSTSRDELIAEKLEKFFTLKQDDINNQLRTGIEQGYTVNDPDRSINLVVNDLRTSFVTDIRIMLNEVSGVELSNAQIKKTSEPTAFRKFISRASKSGDFNRYLAAVKNNMRLKSDSAHIYTVEYIYNCLDKPLNVGANHKRNDITDAFIVGHLIDPKVAILTRDQPMIDALSNPFFRKALTIDEALASL